VPAQYFVDLYRRERDPWNFETSEYERAKYEATLRALPKPHYDNALEIACSIGVFTSMLAQRTRALLAVDVSPEALERARRNCARYPHVRFERRTMPYEYPQGRFDLTTVCEIGFYLGAHDLAALRRNVIENSTPGAHIVLVHWTPPVKGHASTTEEVHAAFRNAPQLRALHGFSHKTYRLDVLEKREDA
jgi:cyclopropane fatty-acyl-phospholipid synthase-like methyltransferase